MPLALLLTHMGSSEAKGATFAVTCKPRHAAVVDDKVIGGVDAHEMDMGIPFLCQAVALPDHHGTTTAVRDQCHKSLYSHALDVL